MTLGDSTDAEIIDLADERQARSRGGWAVSFAICRAPACEGSWIAVHPSCDVKLECPSCGERAGDQVSEDEWRAAQIAKHSRDGKVILSSNRFGRRPQPASNEPK